MNNQCERIEPDMRNFPELAELLDAGAKVNGSVVSLPDTCRMAKEPDDMYIVVATCSGDMIKQFADNGDEIAIDIIGDKEIRLTDEVLFVFHEDSETGDPHVFAYRNPYLISDGPSNGMSNLVQREKATMPGITNITGRRTVDIKSTKQSSIKDILCTLIHNLSLDNCVRVQITEKDEREIIEIKTT